MRPISLSSLSRASSLRLKLLTSWRKICTGKKLTGDIHLWFTRPILIMKPVQQVCLDYFIAKRASIPQLLHNLSIENICCCRNRPFQQRIYFVLFFFWLELHWTKWLYLFLYMNVPLQHGYWNNYFLLSAFNFCFRLSTSEAATLEMRFRGCCKVWHNLWDRRHPKVTRMRQK